MSTRSPSAPAEDRSRTRLCSMRLEDPRQLRQFQEAVQQLYWYQLDVDGLPVWGMVGEWLAADFAPEVRAPPTDPLLTEDRLPASHLCVCSSDDGFAVRVS